MSWALARINWMKYLSVGWSHSPCSHNANTRQTIQIWERENLSYCTGLQEIEASHLSSGQLVIKITPSRHYHSNHLFSHQSSHCSPAVSLYCPTGGWNMSELFRELLLLLSPVYWQELVTSCDPDSYNSLRGLTFRVSKRNTVWCLRVQRVLQDLVHCCHNMSECRHLHPTHILSPASMK